MFKIDKKTGDITLVAELDYEKEQHHTFVVSAKDPKSPKKSTCTDVTINVLDFNDNAPVINYHPTSIRVEVVMYTVFIVRDGSSMIWWVGGGGGEGVLCQLWCRVVSVMCAARPSTCLTTAKSCLTTVFEL